MISATEYTQTQQTLRHHKLKYDDTTKTKLANK
jgi:hypothetical protein